MFNSPTIPVSSEDLVIDKFIGIMLNEFMEEVTLHQIDKALIPCVHPTCSDFNDREKEKDFYPFIRNKHKPPEKVQSFIYMCEPNLMLGFFYYTPLGLINP